jgi:hypothetical protein
VLITWNDTYRTDVKDTLWTNGHSTRLDVRYSGVVREEGSMGRGAENEATCLRGDISDLGRSRVGAGGGMNGSEENSLFLACTG